jgi:hypothetical protein
MQALFSEGKGLNTAALALGQTVCTSRIVTEFATMTATVNLALYWLLAMRLALPVVGLGCSTRHVEIFFQAMLQMTWLRGIFGRQWVRRPGNAF